jgi:ankyrin repeat protein
MDSVIPYLAAACPASPIVERLQPYLEYENTLRKLFARQPENPVLGHPHVGVVPVFKGHAEEIKTQTRNLASDEENQRYIMPLSDSDRKHHGDPAVVGTLKEFEHNLGIFSESSLSALDWSNLVVAGSAVVTSLLPVPKEYAGSDKSLREYYHEIFAPASDVDIFLYGLSEDDAITKIIQIEKQVRVVAGCTTTVRTKNAVTICSEYPRRHVQIVLRIYKSVSEILTGFDVDCSCAAYDGSQVWATPRALASYMTQVNHIDLSRRSPSYESRLAKYAGRGFEIYWPELDRTRVNPNIFEELSAVHGLARLLVLERNPDQASRHSYTANRRSARGLPATNPIKHQGRPLNSNLKDGEKYIQEDDASDYHTFTIPYGASITPGKIAAYFDRMDGRLKADPEVYLHRHLAFVGDMEHVINDCCGSCPKPLTPEECQRHVSGELSFIKVNPGRQAIGSFNPITDGDWTAMAYVGDAACLRNAIVGDDLKAVEDLLTRKGANPNRRDHAGQTPLELAVRGSDASIVQCLVDNGARITDLTPDGSTALHKASTRGVAEIVRILLAKSKANRHLELQAVDEVGGTEEWEEIGLDDDDDADTEVVVAPARERSTDFYRIDSPAWADPTSPFHLAVIHGHVDVVNMLYSEFGERVLSPVQLFDRNHNPKGDIVPLVLALRRSCVKDDEAMAEALIKLGASPAEPDSNGVSVLHHYVGDREGAMNVLVEHNMNGVLAAINRLSITGSWVNPSITSPLLTAIARGHSNDANGLLELGAEPQIRYDRFRDTFMRMFGDESRACHVTPECIFQNVIQPMICAVKNELPSVALSLIEAGADVDPVSGDDTVLDRTQRKLQSLLGELASVDRSVTPLPETDDIPLEEGRERNVGELIQQYVKLEHKLITYGNLTGNIVDGYNKL